MCEFHFTGTPVSQLFLYFQVYKIMLSDPVFNHSITNNRLLPQTTIHYLWA